MKPVADNKHAKAIRRLRKYCVVGKNWIEKQRCVMIHILCVFSWVSRAKNTYLMHNGMNGANKLTVSDGTVSASKSTPVDIMMHSRDMANASESV